MILFTGSAGGAEVRVMISAGHKVVTARGASMGTAPNSIPSRLQRGEPVDVPGIDFVGPLPAEVHKITVFSAGIAAGATEPDAARALIKFLASPSAAPAIAKSALEPMTP